MPYLGKITYIEWLRRMVDMTKGDQRLHYLDLIANMQGRA